jgi:hypothetical protein
MANGLVFWVSAGFTIVLAVFVLLSIIGTTKPVGSQNQALFGTVLAISVIAGILGWIIGYFAFKGNPTAQLQFLLFFTFLLFITTTTSAITSAYQLYGLRDALASKPPV